MRSLGSQLLNPDDLESRVAESTAKVIGVRCDGEEAFVGGNQTGLKPCSPDYFLQMESPGIFQKYRYLAPTPRHSDVIGLRCELSSVIFFYFLKLPR